MLLTSRAHQPGVLEGLLGRLGLRPEPGRVVVHLAQQQPRLGQAEVVVELGQPGDRLLSLPAGRLGAVGVGMGQEPHPRVVKGCAPGKALLSAGPGHGRRLGEHVARLLKLADVHKGHAKVWEQLQPCRLFCWQQGGRSVQQTGGGRSIVSHQRPLPGRAKLRSGPAGQRPGMVVRRPELHAESEGLLQVVADQLLLLGHALPGHLLQPEGETLV